MKRTRSTSSAPASPGLRLHLQRELARRCSANPQYSLRAFALDLDVDHSTLSQILRRKRVLSPSMIQRLGARLKLSEADIARFLSAEAHGGDWVSADAVEELAHDVAAAISDGAHYAILELVRVEGFQPDSRWIARVLGLTVDEVNVALQRLLRLELLEMSSPTRWTAKLGDATASFEGFADQALARIVDEVRELASRGAGLRPREHSAIVIALDTRRLPEALAILARAQSELVKLLEHDGPRDDVYRLDIHFYPLTRLKAEEASDDESTRDAVPDPGQEA